MGPLVWANAGGLVNGTSDTTLLKLLSGQEGSMKATVTLSIEIACYPMDGVTYDKLFQAADQAMYQAKRLGKNQYCFSDGRN